LVYVARIASITLRARITSVGDSFASLDELQAGQIRRAQRHPLSIEAKIKLRSLNFAQRPRHRHIATLLDIARSGTNAKEKIAQSVAGSRHASSARCILDTAAATFRYCPTFRSPKADT
jgi:hypothetical protein